MKTINERWREFESESGLINGLTMARRDSRRAFYAGYYSALLTAAEIAAEHGDNIDARHAVLEELHMEIRRFIADRVSGHA
jgi:hypothetical protein